MLHLLLLACSSPPLTMPTNTIPSFEGDIPQNLLVVSIDTFRKDAMEATGAAESQVPFLDSIAASGQVLQKHRSCANWTLPSILCVQEGRTNVDAGYVPDAFAVEPVPDHPTLASHLADAGWETILLTSNSLFSSDHNSDQGFQVSMRPDDLTAAGLFTEGMNQISAAQSPWYLHLHLREPHLPYDPPAEYLSGLDELEPIPWDLNSWEETLVMTDQWMDMSEEEQELVLAHLKVRYAGELRWMDDQIRAAWSEMKSAGMLDNTLVVFWSDHGEQFWEHGQQAHSFGLHREENDAIAFFWADNIVPGAWNEPTYHPDIAPTILNLLGQSIPAEMTGEPLGFADPSRPMFLSTHAQRGVVQAVVQDGWKMILEWETGDRFLYDVEADPTESKDLYEPTLALPLETLLTEEAERLEPLVIPQN